MPERIRQKRGGSRHPKKENRASQLSILEKKLKIKFKNKPLLRQALTHPSFAHEEHEEKDTEDYQRLEFLGDSFLGLVVSHLLYETNPTADEGVLTKMKSHLVSAKFLIHLAEEINLAKFLRLGQGDRHRIHASSSMTADAFEALIGAIFLDQGYEKASKFVESFYKSHLKTTDAGEENYKGVLQEILQRKYKEHPRYELAAEYGPDHSKMFEVKVLFRGKVFGIGSGKSKKEAERFAAREALAILGRE